MKAITKSLLIIIVIILTLTIMPVEVFGHEVELDPENYIHMPYAIWNGKGTISVAYRIEDEDYNLYYQWHELPDEVYATIKAKIAEVDAYKETADPIIDEKEDIADALFEAYKVERDLDPDSEATETARVEYQAAVGDYNDAVDDYNTTMGVFRTELSALKPMYDENAWIRQDDGEIDVEDTTANYTGEKGFLLWAKLELNGESHFDEQLYVLNGTKKPDVDVTGVKFNVKSLKIKAGESINLTATVSPSNATNKRLIWSSSNESVATVEGGMIKALSVGTAEITVETEDGSFKDTCIVTVVGANVKEEEKEIEEDDTKVPMNKIPDAGIKIIMPITIIALFVGSIILYKKRNEYNF